MKWRIKKVTNTDDTIGYYVEFRHFFMWFVVKSASIDDIFQEFDFYDKLFISLEDALAWVKTGKTQDCSTLQIIKKTRIEYIQVS